jgi:aldehyde:ferredoxin oxidoreductase
MKAEYGYMGKVLFVDLTNRKIHEEELSEKIARNFIGGYGVGARMIMERMKAGADPFEPENILGFGTGPLTLSGMTSTCRFTVMGKSPLTGYWGDANSGGNFANDFKASGYDAVFFEGRADRPVYLLMRDGKVEFKDARHLWGVDTVKTEKMIRQENGNPRLKIACIGTAGEKRSRIAAVINDWGRAAARSGLGGVMGSKNLKAIACIGSQKLKIFDKVRVENLMKDLVRETKSNPSGMVQILTRSGTPGAMMPHMAMHDVPIKNWAGNNIEDFPESKWESVSWECLEKYVTKKYACSSCFLTCGHWVKVSTGKYKVEKGHKPEYETMAAIGPLCLNDNMESLIYSNELCNLHGLDTISAGGILAFAIECYEKGLISKKDTDGLELTWGNTDAIVGVLKKMCLREGIGDLLAEGSREAAKRIGRGAEQFSMDVGGELIPMHDPRQVPGIGATYVSDPTPARHTRSGTAFQEEGMANPVTMNILGLPLQMERYDPAGKGKAHSLVTAWQHLINTTGLCIFAGDGLNFSLLEMMRAVMGWNLDHEELIKTGKRISTLLHAFNLREGFKPADFTMPPRPYGNPPLKVGTLKGITVDVENLKRQYYEAMGFDPATGEIQKDRIEELGLQNLVYTGRG